MYSEAAMAEIKAMAATGNSGIGMWLSSSVKLNPVTNWPSETVIGADAISCPAPPGHSVTVSV